MHGMWRLPTNNSMPALAFDVSGQKQIGIGLSTRSACCYCDMLTCMCDCLNASVTAMHIWISHENGTHLE